MTSKRPGIFYGWWVVAACVFCLSTSPGQYIFSSLGLFIIPLNEEFGWDRAEISLAVTFFTATLAISIPFLGHLVDRYGSRRVLIPSVLVLGVGLMSITLVNKLWQLYLLFTVLGCLTAGANSLPYLRTLSLWFDRRRGLALGIAMTGNGLGFAYVPPLVQFAIVQGGWRAGYFTLAAVCILVAAPIIYFWIRESPASLGFEPDGAAGAAVSASTEVGVSRGEAMRTRLFWTLACIFAAFSFCLFGLLPHLVPMLTDRGMGGGDAASAAAMIGVAIIASRLLIGYILDNVFGPYVALASMLLAALGLGMLAMGVTGPDAYGAAILVGIGVGAELDLLAYLVGRYFGLRFFGQIYGFLFAAFLLGGALGPYGYGITFEVTGSYTLILGICTAITALAGLANATLPPYPDLASWAQESRLPSSPSAP